MAEKPKAFGERYMVKPGKSFKLADCDPRAANGFTDKEATKADTVRDAAAIDALQDRLFAEGKRALLVILQGSKGEARREGGRAGRHAGGQTKVENGLVAAHGETASCLLLLLAAHRPSRPSHSPVHPPLSPPPQPWPCPCQQQAPLACPGCWGGAAPRRPPCPWRRQRRRACQSSCGRGWAACAGPAQPGRQQMKTADGTWR